MKILVTGGAGFIGSHLVERLLELQNEVVMLDNFSNGSMKNLKHLEPSPHLHIHEIDIADGAALRPYFKGAEAVYHLAALADIVPSIENPMEYFRVNVDGTAHVMECARREGVQRVLYAASSSCYGTPDAYPTSESAEIHPQYPYALTKYLGERIALHWGQVYKIRVNSVRLFNVYGLRARTSGTYGAVFKVFLPQKIYGKPFTVVGDGTQTRDFTYVTDAVSAILAVSESPVSNEIFNVGSGKTVSVNRIVELLGGEKVFIPKRPGEPDHTFADISKIKTQIGWSPRVSVEEGVARLLENLDDWRDEPVWTPERITDATREWFHYLAG